jgi:hypothetical protein
VLAIAQLLQELGKPALEVVGVKADGWRGYPEMPQQLGRMPRILCRNQVRLAQDTQASKGHVLEIADRSRDHGQEAGHRQKT